MTTVELGEGRTAAESGATDESGIAKAAEVLVGLWAGAGTASQQTHRRVQSFDRSFESVRVQ